MSSKANKFWSDEDHATAHRLVADGADEATCMATIGRTLSATRARVEIARQQQETAARARAEDRRVRARIAEARERACAQQSITALLFDDPLPGQSALDQRGGLV